MADNRTSDIKKALLAIRELKAKIKQLESNNPEPIAVIGMGCRFPGGVYSPENYWQLLTEKIDAISEVPSDRWDINEYFDEKPGQPGKMYTRWGGFLDHIDQFDPHFFGISPREAAALDPQQRLLLEVSWEAMENSGLNPHTLEGSNTGVFIGITASDYAFQQIREGNTSQIDAYFGTGNALNAAAGRLAYTFGFQGPAMIVDTACSSSLVAIHLACHSLNNRESNLTIAGGVNVILSPESTIATSQAKMLSPIGRCKTFDESADGYVRGEGCGIVVLKRLADALKNGDAIQGVIKATAVNQDGQSAGFTVPNGVVQQKLIEEALNKAQLSPKDIDYIEAHGTGTSLGDPIEVNALNKVFGVDRDNEYPLLVGSVKTNIGHLESASGIAGLIKTLLALQHQKIPAHLHLNKVNPHIPLANIPISVPVSLSEWPNKNTLRRAGVSSFGFSGTNAHVIIEQSPEIPPARQDSRLPGHLLTISARNESSLKQLAGNLKESLSQKAESPIADFCFTSNTGRAHFQHRIGILGSNINELEEALACYLEGKKSPTLYIGAPKQETSSKKVFLFTGQGSQYADMGGQLYQNQPTFRYWMDECARFLEAELESSLLSVIYGENSHLLNHTAYTQPALFALEYSLFQLWKSWGIHPDAVTGHSVGEFTAACAAGIYSLEDGLKLIAARGRLMQSLPAGGGMLAVFANEQQVLEIIAPYSASISLASINGPQSMVVSGSKTSLKQIQLQCDNLAIKTYPLTVSHAFHSPLMEPILEEFARVAEQMTYQQAKIPLISNMTGNVVENVDADHWKHHVRQPVRFYDGMLAIESMGFKRFLEIGPNPVLTGLGKQCIPNTESRWMASLRRGFEDWGQLLQSLAILYTEGEDIDWNAIYQDTSGYQKVNLPNYPFQRQRYWKTVLSLEDQLKSAAQTFASNNIEKIQPRDVDKKQAALDKLCLAYFTNHLASRQVFQEPGAQLKIEEFVEQIGLSPRYHQLFANLLNHLVKKGIIEKKNQDFSVIQVLTEQAIDPLLKNANDLNEESLPLVNLIKTCGSHLSEVLDGNKDPIDVLFPGGDFKPLESLYRSTPFSRYYNGVVASIVEKLIDSLPANTQLRLLEIGAGTGSTTASVVPLLPSDRTSYLFTDISEIFLNKARFKFSDYSFITYQTLDIEKDPVKQGFNRHGYDLVIAANVLHATKNINETIKQVKSLLAPGGLLVMWEITEPSPWFDLTFGMVLQDLEDKELRSDSAFLNREQWESLLKNHGFTGFASFPSIEFSKSSIGQQVIMAKTPTTVNKATPAFQAIKKKPIQPSISHDRDYPLLGSRINSPYPTFQNQLSLIDQPYLNDHRPFGTIVFPMTGYLEMGLRAAQELDLGKAVELRSFQFSDALILDEEYPARDIQTIITYEHPDLCTIEYHSHPKDTDDEKPSNWKLHTKGRFSSATDSIEAVDDNNLEKIKARCTEPVELQTFYQELESKGLNYRGQFRSIETLKKGKKTVLAQIKTDQQSINLENGFIVHPGVLDSCFQILGILIANNAAEPSPGIYMPYYLEKFQLFGEIGSVAWCYAKLISDANEKIVSGSFILYDAGDRQIAAIDNLKLKKIKPHYFRQLHLPKQEDWFYRVQWHADEISKITLPEPVEETEYWLIVVDDPSHVEGLKTALSKTNRHCIVVQTGSTFEKKSNGFLTLDPFNSEGVERCLDNVTQPGNRPLTAILFFGFGGNIKLDSLVTDSISKRQQTLCGGLLYLIQALNKSGIRTYPQLFILTQGTQSVDPHDGSTVLDSPLWGLGRNIANEIPDLNCKLIDLDSIEQTSSELLLRELLVDAGTIENQVAFRQNKRFVGHLERYPGKALQASQELPQSPYSLTIDKPGLLGHLKFKPANRRALNSDEVEIEVLATGVNFRDLMIAMDIYPGEKASMGVECSGIVTAVGNSVTSIHVGDKVIAIASGCYASHVITNMNLVVPKPDSMSFEEAATVLNVFLSAAYPLQELVDLKKGDNVLIHSASGGVGLAAIQIAKAKGASIYTTAGKDFKRDYLHTLDLQYVGDSRSLNFADEISKIAGEETMDVILNSLVGEAIDKSLSLLKPGGHFVELGKTDIRSAEQIAALNKDIVYHPVALDVLTSENPELIGKVLNRLSKAFENNEYVPLPKHVFQAEKLVDAFRLMQQANHIGKIVISYRHHLAKLKNQEGLTITENSTYLITGGMGGLGLRVARWLVEKGARHILLTGRSEPGPTALPLIEELKQGGANVQIETCDVSTFEDMKQIIDVVNQSDHPLKGVWHCAGLLEDAVLTNLDWRGFHKVLAAKVEGTWNLHLLTKTSDLDYFVLFSSVASLFGTPGQGNHAAANAFLDSVAHYRQAIGLPALAINWGAWSEIGAAAFKQEDSSLESQGIGFISPDQGIAAMEQALVSAQHQLVVLPISWSTFARSMGNRRLSPLFTKLVQSSPIKKPLVSESAVSNLLEQVRQVPLDQRLDVLKKHLVLRIAEVLGWRKPESLDTTESLIHLGMDSLMAVELKNLIGQDLGGIPLPDTLLLDQPNVDALADYLIKKLPVADSETPKQEETTEQAVIDERTVSSKTDSSQYPLTLAQKGIWALYKMHPSMYAYNVIVGLRIKSELDIQILQECFQELTKRHAALRTRIVTIDNEPCQQVMDHVDLKIHIHHIEDAQSDSLKDRVLSHARKPFVLEQGPLVRVDLFQSGQETVLLLVFHHIIIDGASCRILWEELVTMYSAQTSGKPVVMEPLKNTFADYVQKRQNALTDPSNDRHLTYWKKLLKAPLPKLDLPLDYPRPSHFSYNGDSHSFVLDADLVDRIYKFCREENCTLNMLMFAAFEILLARLSGQDDIIIGIGTSGRNFPGFERVVGFFINVLALRGDLSKPVRFRKFLNQTKEMIIESLKHQDYPFQLLTENLNLPRDPSRPLITQAVLNLQSESMTPASGRQNDSDQTVHLISEPYEIEDQTGEAELTLEIIEQDRTLKGALKFNSDLFRPETIERWTNNFLTLLNAILENPNATIDTLNILNDAERHILLKEFQGTKAEFPLHKSIVNLFEEQVDRTPNQIALIHDKKQLTYKELDNQANQLTKAILEQKIEQQSVVCVYLDKSPELIISLLAILKTRCIYLPLDTSYPEDRVQFILNDSSAKMVITDQTSSANLSTGIFNGLILDIHSQLNTFDSADAPGIVGKPDDIAYVIYTSGSTGQPKGVQVPNRGIVNVIHDHITEVGISPDDRCLQFCAITFDVSILEYFMPLLAGAGLVLASTETIKDGLKMIRYLEEHNVTVASFTASYLKALGQHPLPTVRTLMVGGEPADRKDVHFYARHKNYYNAYGPSECSVCASHYKCSPGAALRTRIPIGKPVRNGEMYVLDEYLNPVPIGVRGEICVAGPGLSVGYLNRPELTEQTFVDHPFKPGKKIYRTGDIGRWLPEGVIEFLGRKDDQVKIRGHRIETREIENVLLAMPEVGNAVVMDEKNQSGDLQLTAYLLAKNSNDFPSEKVVRKRLSKKLPEYMIPAEIQVLQSFPTTTSGKIDRNSLPKIVENVAASSITEDAPTDVQQKLLEIWKNILGKENIKVTDNFFEIGGNSLLAIQVVSGILKEFNKEIPMSLFFRNQSIEDLSSFIGDEVKKTYETPLVSIQPKGSKSAVFCFHGAGGNVMCFQPLADQLGKDRPLFALQSILFPHENRTIYDMANEYYFEIREKQKNGPYNLVGYCLGGCIAQEVAQQFRRAGEEVNLILLDSYLLKRWQIGLWMNWTKTIFKIFKRKSEEGYSDFQVGKRFRWKLFQDYVNGTVELHGKKASIPYHKYSSLDLEDRYQLVTIELNRKGVLNAPIEMETLVSEFKEFEANNLALLNYKPQLYAGKTLLITAEETYQQPGIYSNEDHGFAATNSYLEIKQVPGNHFSILTEPYVEFVAKIIEDNVE